MVGEAVGMCETVGVEDGTGLVGAEDIVGLWEGVLVGDTEGRALGEGPQTPSSQKQGLGAE